MRHTISRIVFTLALALFAITSGGCSKEKLVDVTGRVTYNGSTLNKPSGQIAFVGPSGIQAAAPIEPDGTYRVTGVSPGLNRVAVYYSNPAGAKTGKQIPDPAKKGAPAPQAPTISPFLTPTKYASADTSELSIQVVDNGTTFDVNMTGPRIP
jgi:hypothetical protein